MQARPLLQLNKKVETESALQVLKSVAQRRIRTADLRITNALL